MKQIFYLTAVICAVFMAAISPAGEMTQMDEVVVTAGRLEEKKQDVTTNITVIKESDIKTSTVQDLGDLLANEGFMIREYPNSTIAVEIRGFRTETHGNDLASNVLILVNGRRAGTGNLAKIPMNNVERIEIIRGPGSVQYGASAMGGVVNVITKKGEGDLSGSAQFTLGSWKHQQATADISGSIEAFDFSVGATKSHQNDYETGDGVTYYNTGYDNKQLLNLNTGWTFAQGNRIGITYSSYEGEGIGQPGYLSANDLDDYIDHALESFDINYTGQTSDKFLSWDMRYFMGKDTYKTYDPSTSSDPDYYRDTDHQGAQAQLTAEWDMIRLTVGTDWTHYTISNTNTAAGRDNTYDNPSAFILTKTSLLEDKLIFSLGGRYDRYEVENDAGQSKEDSNWSMSAGVIYKVMPLLSVRANYAEGFRMPTAGELYLYQDYGAWGIWSGNENLNPESSKTYEIGLDVNKDSFFGSITYFTTDYDDKIDYELVGGVNLYSNIEGATISGFEGTVQWDIGQWFDWMFELIPYGSFTALTDYENEDTNENLKYTPEWTAAWGIKLIHSEYGFSSRLNFAYVGEQDIDDWEGTGATTLEDHTVADLTVTKTLFSFEQKGNLDLELEITNLFDESYAEIQGYPAPGRGFYFGIRYQF